MERLGILRGVQIARLTIAPFKYNPVSNELMIFNNIELHVSYGNADYDQTQLLKEKNYTPAFNPSFSQLLNYKPLAKDLITTYPVKYVIVSECFKMICKTLLSGKQKGF